MWNSELIFTILYVFSSFVYVRAQNGICAFNLNVQAGQIYSIDCPRYSSCYSQCSWALSCPSGYNCRADCQINVPANQQCSRGQIQVSKSGDPGLRDAEVYCGQGTVTAVSTKQNLIINLLTPERVGYFSCNVITQRVQPPSNCNCGIKKVRRIVNGEDTIPNEYPMMAGLLERGKDTIVCGGTIISKRYVVTAAHCVVGKIASNLGVVVGEHDTSRGDDSPSTKGYAVAGVRIHPNYNNYTYDYDVGILSLTEIIQFSENVMPVCLPFKFAGYSFTGEKLTVLGWGTIFIGGPKSDVLQKVQVDVISQNDCRNNVRSLTPRQLCTYTPGKDACQFDSGGPLLFTDRETSFLFLSAMVSTGELCAGLNKPAVNTRVTDVLDWIVQTAPDDYCVK
ncbi:venom serine protease-like [Pieris rapae]|uniref:venom serine protease-like n=1 Tax=Pieris rapae TaxID=64459 RepID=UPI001E27D865|nr:venom serine protease-like [Pieris rapae]